MTSSSISDPVVRINSPYKPDHGHCLINLLAQKRWSLQVPLWITYLTDSNSLNSPTMVTAKIFAVRWPHPLSSTEKLPSYQVLNMQAEFINTGKYDKNLLYDTAQLISFPPMNSDSDSSYATIQLCSNKEETINMKITIPDDFPDDLLSKPVFIEVHSKVDFLNSEASLALCMIVIDTSAGNTYANNNDEKRS